MTYREVQFEMKDSGVEWIAQIPKNWQVKRLKNLFSFGKGLPITKADLVENGVAVISYGQIHAKSNTGTHLSKELLRFVPEIFLETNPSSLISKHDIIFADTSEDLDGLGNAVLMDIDGKVFAGYHTIILHPIDTRFSKYLAYLFLTDAWRSQLRASANGIKVFSVTQKMLRSCNVILPYTKECDIITSFLDTQCIKIDSIISEAKASIEEYKSWKASIIYEAVTKGLDPNVEMKDSGVEWIGKMPTHWLLSRVKNETKNLDYLREPISAENRDNKLGLYDYYGASGVIDKIDDYNVDDTVLLIGEDGANLRMRNLPLVYRASGKFWVNNHAHILKVNEQNNYSYMAYLLEAGDYTTYITGAAQPKLSQFTLMRFPIPIAPRQEQDAIEEYLNKKTGEIQSLIAEKESLIADLESYKKSLIFEVVTGKRRVV